LLDATAEDDLEPLYALAATTGLRLGELLGLSWADVDVAAGTLSVRRSLAKAHGGGWALAEPKSARSRRTLPLAVRAREALTVARSRQRFAQSAAGDAWQDRDGLVLPPVQRHPYRGWGARERAVVQVGLSAGVSGPGTRRDVRAGRALLARRGSAMTLSFGERDTQAALAENAVELRRAYRRRTVMERVRLLGVLTALGGLLIVLAAAALLFLDVIDPGPAAVMGIVGISLMAAMSLVTVTRRY
jgi:integrase